MVDLTPLHQSIKRIDKVIYTRLNNGKRQLAHDNVVTEQPLQITLHWQSSNEEPQSKVFAITMRTLGDDKFLILGLLFSEGVIKSISDVASISPEYGSQQRQENNWQVYLTKKIKPKLTSIERFQTTYSSCGLCGATSLKALELNEPPNLLAVAINSQCSANLIYTLASKMRAKQQLFMLTGGIHGAALFNQQTELLAVFEDIGRHNAVDKLIGQRICQQTLPKAQELMVMLVSGRVSFEIIQKAVMAGISILVAVGAPSDLAIKAAQRFELTLIGFVNENSFNVYHGDWRITEHVNAIHGEHSSIES